MAEKEACGIRLSVWAKIANMLLGALMIFYSIITFFTIALDIFDDASFILIISFRIYEMYVISPLFHHNSNLLLFCFIACLDCF